MLQWVAVLLIGLSVFLILKTMFQDEGQYRASEQLEDDTLKREAAKHGIILRYSRPFFKRYVSPIVASMKRKGKIRDLYKRKLATSGLTDLLTPDDFYSFKLFLIVGFPITYLAVRLLLEESWPLTIVFVVAPLGYIYPDIWIKKKIEMRQNEIQSSMPFAVDMLALSVEAGLDFVAAMQKVIERAKPSALTQEFERFIKETKVGSSRAEGLRNMAWRINMIQMSSFCATLIAADSVGASIGPILKALSNEMRQKRSSMIEKKAAEAATKITLPLMLFIVPSVFIMILGPAFLSAGLQAK